MKEEVRRSSYFFGKKIGKNSSLMPLLTSVNVNLTHCKLVDYVL